LFEDLVKRVLGNRDQILGKIIDILLTMRTITLCVLLKIKYLGIGIGEWYQGLEKEVIIPFLFSP